MLLEKIKDWLEYKKEKNQGYKPKGLESLLTQIFNKYKEFGEGVVASIISESMANNWQGIVWDRLKKTQANSGNYAKYNAKPANGFDKVFDEFGLGEEKV